MGPLRYSINVTLNGCCSPNTVKTEPSHGSLGAGVVPPRRGGSLPRRGQKLSTS